MNALRQLPLPFLHVPGFSAVDFLTAPSNEAAYLWLHRDADWPQRRLALWGPAGCGKTHLLHVWAGRNGANLLAGPGLRFDASCPKPGQALAIDDADTAPELPLLRLLNAAEAAGQEVLLASRTPPSRWATALPDLASRLRAVTAVEIGAAEDELLGILLARLLAERQVAVPAANQDWLRQRLPRTAAAMREAAARLDRAMLAAGGGVSRGLLATVVDAMSDPPGTPEDEL